jgi:hypothetical protein
MFAMISPVDFNAEETFSTLSFAMRVRKVELGKATKQGGSLDEGGASKKKGRGAPSRR